MNLDDNAKAYKGSIYDFDNKILLNWYSKRVKETSKNTFSALELGIGHGITTQKFSEYFSKNVVIEGSLEVINSFHRNFPNCATQIINTYFEEYESDETFDVIIMGFVLEHVDDPVKLLQKFRKFLKKDGSIFIAVPNAESLNRHIGCAAGLLKDFYEMSDNDILLGHKRYYTVTSLARDIRAANYYIDFIEGIYLKPFTTEQIISLNLDDAIIDAICKVGIDYPELCCALLIKAYVE